MGLCHNGSAPPRQTQPHARSARRAPHLVIGSAATTVSPSRDELLPPSLPARAWHLLWRLPGVVLVLTAIVVAAAAGLASRLELRTNVAELLPSSDPAVEELQRLSERIGGTSILQIAVESPDRDGQPASGRRARPRSCARSAPTSSQT